MQWKLIELSVEIAELKLMLSFGLCNILLSDFAAFVDPDCFSRVYCGTWNKKHIWIFRFLLSMITKREASLEYCGRSLFSQHSRQFRLPHWNWCYHLIYTIFFCLCLLLLERFRMFPCSVWWYWKRLSILPSMVAKWSPLEDLLTNR